MKVITTIALLTLAATGTTVQAEDVRYYDLEVIIFETLSEEGRTSEVWKNDVVIEPPETMIEFGKPYPGKMPKEYLPQHTFKLLPKKSYRLAEEAKFLIENDQYRILMHTAWRQPGMAADVTIPIHLHKEFIVTRKITETPVTTDPDTAEVIPTEPVVTTKQTRAVLDGYLKLVLSRYLHANFNLVYNTGLPVSPVTIPASIDPAKGADPANQNQQKIVSYQLQQTRKMRSKEVHYIDHPVLGIVLLAWPYLIEEQ